MKYKKRIPGHKKLLNLFNDLLDIILTDKTLESESRKDGNKMKMKKQKVKKKKIRKQKVEKKKLKMMIKQWMKTKKTK